MSDIDGTGICARCGADAFDAVDLCEDCLALVTLGQIARGEYGEEERMSLRSAIADSYWIDAPKRHWRWLMATARKYS